jgi:hypothetical protein
MITGTYDIQVTNVYTDLAKFPSTFTGPEWKLFRERLTGDRRNYQGSNAGVQVEQVGRSNSYPLDGPTRGNPSVIENLGVAYVEFYTSTLNLPPGAVADLHLTIVIRKKLGQPDPKVSMVPISSFSATPLPNNNFINPTIGGINLLYDVTQVNFNRLDRVVLIISNYGAPVDFSYYAEVTIR